MRRVRNCPGVYRKSSSSPSGTPKTIDLASAVSSITSVIVSSRTNEPSCGVSVMGAKPIARIRGNGWSQCTIADGHDLLREFLTQWKSAAVRASLGDVERVDHVLLVGGVDSLGESQQPFRVGVPDAREHLGAGVLTFRPLAPGPPFGEDRTVTVAAPCPLDGGVLLGVLAHQRACAAVLALDGLEAGTGVGLAIELGVVAQPRGASRVRGVPGRRAPRVVVLEVHLSARDLPASPATSAMPVYW